MSDPITITESARLVELEKVIKRGLSNFIEVGEALAEVRDSKLYRIEHDTFENYCRKKWGMTRQNASLLIGASKVTAELSSTLDSAPTSVRQATPLTKLETPEQQREAWTTAVEASDGKPTAKHVEAAVDEIKSREEAPAPKEEEAPTKYEPANGLQYADMAIASLQNIHRNDTQRDAAFSKVTRWITKQK